MNNRSWSYRLGIMLVPSTFTGRYRNRITSIAIRPESIRSRNQATVVMSADFAREGACATSGALVVGCGSVIRLFSGQFRSPWARMYVKSHGYSSLPEFEPECLIQSGL